LFARAPVTLEEASERRTADGEPVRSGEPVAVLEQGGVRAGVDLGHAQPFLLGREPTATTGTGLGIKRQSLAKQCSIARQRAGTAPGGAGNLGIA